MPCDQGTTGDQKRKSNLLESKVTVMVVEIETRQHILLSVLHSGLTKKAWECTLHIDHKANLKFTTGLEAYASQSAVLITA